LRFILTNSLPRSSGDGKTGSPWGMKFPITSPLVFKFGSKSDAKEYKNARFQLGRLPSIGFSGLSNRITNICQNII